MKKLLQFTLWPALAGLVFGLVLAALPSVIEHLPGLYLLSPASRGDAPPHATASYAPAIRRAAPAVVSINSQQVFPRVVETYDFANPFRPEVKILPDESNSLGSGVIISPDGFVISSYHIFVGPNGVPFEEDISVTLHDGRTLEARRLVMDRENDLALLKIDDDRPLPHIRADSLNRLQVGDVVLAIGNPRNIGQSVSQGIVSALLRQGDSYVIQTDAAINPGNSGGALIDVQGNLIGINSAIVSESGGSEGIAFATPAGEAMDLLDKYLASGPSGYLGIDIDMTLDTMTQTVRIGMAQVPLGEEVVRGILVTGVFRNGPAARAGIAACDILTRVDEHPIETEEDALAAIAYTSNKTPGEEVKLRIFRNGEFLDLAVRLGVGEPNREIPISPSSAGCSLPSM